MNGWAMIFEISHPNRTAIIEWPLWCWCVCATHMNTYEFVQFTSNAKSSERNSRIARSKMFYCRLVQDYFIQDYFKPNHILNVIISYDAWTFTTAKRQSCFSLTGHRISVWSLGRKQQNARRDFGAIEINDDVRAWRARFRTLILHEKKKTQTCHQHTSIPADDWSLPEIANLRPSVWLCHRATSPRRDCEKLFRVGPFIAAPFFSTFGLGGLIKFEFKSREKQHITVEFLTENRFNQKSDPHLLTITIPLSPISRCEESSVDFSYAGVNDSTTFDKHSVVVARRRPSCRCNSQRSLLSVWTGKIK